MSDTAIAKREETTVLASFDPKTHNILSPALAVKGKPDYIKEVAAAVEIDADTEAYKREGKLCLRKEGLTKIASAGGMVIHPDFPKHVRPEFCERCIDMAKATGKAARCGDCPSRHDRAVRVVAAVRSGLGYRLMGATRTFIWEHEEARIERDGKRNNKGEADIADRKLQTLQFADELTETKAIERCVRATFNVRQTYTKEELQRPFVVTRLELDPSHPDVRNLIRQRALASGSDLYGTAGDVAKALPEFEGEPDFEGQPEDLPAEAEEDGSEEREEDGPAPEDHQDPEEPEPEGDPFAGPYQCAECGTDVSFEVAVACMRDHKEEFDEKIYCVPCGKPILDEAEKEQEAKS